MTVILVILKGLPQIDRESPLSITIFFEFAVRGK